MACPPHLGLRLRLKRSFAEQTRPGKNSFLVLVSAGNWLDAISFNRPTLQRRKFICGRPSLVWQILAGLLSNCGEKAAVSLEMPHNPA
jgi:hypothetical protein